MRNGLIRELIYTYLVPEQDPGLCKGPGQFRAVDKRRGKVAEAVQQEEGVGGNVSGPLRRIRLHVALVVLHGQPQDAFGECRV